MSRNEGTRTVILVLATAVGNKTALPKLTTAPVWKFDPLIVSVNVADPFGAAFGDNEVMTGVEGGTYSFTKNDCD